jgi:hypothetical protein
MATGSGRTYIADMVKIAISQEAFDAIAGAMPVESVGFAQANERGERLIWLREAWSRSSGRCEGAGRAIPT